jgi:AraC-like DNA-binding protein
MAFTTREFLSLIRRNIHFEYHLGGTTLVPYPHSTGWRKVPSLIACQLNYASLLEMGDKRRLRIEPGEAFAVAPGVLHRVSKITRRPAYGYWSHFQCEIFQGVSLFYLIEPPLILRGRQARKIGRINRDFAAMTAREPSLTLLLKQQMLGWELILTLLESVRLKEDRIELIRNASRLTPVLAYIEENLTKQISHDLLARTAGLSPSRFHFLFRSALGSSPYHYVQKLRLKKAQQLLIRTDRSVAEIGQEVGYPDPYHFSRIFRRDVGVPPGKYRKQIHQGSF